MTPAEIAATINVMPAVAIEVFADVARAASPSACVAFANDVEFCAAVFAMRP